MRPSLVSTGLVLLTSFSLPSNALLAQSGSPCAVQCGNVLDSTTGSEIVCDDNGYSGAAGTVYQNCINCQLSSTYVDPVTKKSDTQEALCKFQPP